MNTGIQDAMNLGWKLLVRPDGYVAWASATPPTPAAISAAVTQWRAPRSATHTVHSG